MFFAFLVHGFSAWPGICSVLNHFNMFLVFKVPKPPEKNEKVKTHISVKVVSAWPGICSEFIC